MTSVKVKTEVKKTSEESLTENQCSRCFDITLVIGGALGSPGYERVMRIISYPRSGATSGACLNVWQCNELLVDCEGTFYSLLHELKTHHSLSSCMESSHNDFRSVWLLQDIRVSPSEGCNEGHPPYLNLAIISQRRDFWTTEVSL